MDFREHVLTHYQQLVQDRIDAFRDMIDALSEDSRNDAKGSAGDKHETALSMMHIEQEKINRKLAECLEQKAILDRIRQAGIPTRVALGSIVKVNGLYLFIACALPKIRIGNLNVMAVSPSAPLASWLMGKDPNYTFEFNGQAYTIEEII
ncbi:MULTISPECIES: hypothetical protein [unclassified Flavobacterium]|uniref:hypothetical protein n=1 Tax=unclassified Flavobacterium TaxID=196869 RepID=UPI001F1309F9|nr:MULTISPECIES: hypothetical protein [unclassified Flavobacterium]UMY65526.1 hypothetical protein MKO97_13600 [Flavobacterium sp. HJ-32-4]